MAGMMEGKVAVVTGAGGGIGREIAIMMAAAGAKVIVADIGASLTGEGGSATPAEQTKAMIEQKGGQAAICTESVASWSGARMYIAGSVVSSLGYRKGKSYGLTYSTCEYCEADEPGLPRPTGALVGNTFRDMYYGFYSYEADDIAIVGNIYSNNAIYGIDPHDRSRRLIELHGGRIEVESELGRGTTVTIALPAERVIPDLDALPERVADTDAKIAI